MRLRINIIPAVFLTVVFVVTARAQEPVYWETVQKIREEGFQRSQVMDIAEYLTDVIGPRLTGSPNMKRGQQWVKAKMEEMGLVNTVIEPFGEHGVSWDNEFTSLHMLEPDYQPLFGYPLAFTPGTNGKIEGEAMIVRLETDRDREAYRGRLRGIFVLTAPEQPTGPRFSPDAVRRTREELEQLAQVDVSGFIRRRPRGLAAITRNEYSQILQDVSGDTLRKLTEEERLTFLKNEGVGAVIIPGRGGDGTVRVMGRPGSRSNRSYEKALLSPTMVALVPEHYNRIYRILKRGIPVKLSVEVRNSFDNNTTTGYNVVGEIPGSDRADELVMVGGHLDSWHAGTGAADNAAGCAVVLETMRILQAIDARPARTIRIALWSFEEGGLNGSREYVAQHFGDPEHGKKPAYDNFSVYFNMDNGTGQFRGVYLQGNEWVVPLFTEWMKPFHDLGMTTLTLDNTGGTDHLSFDRAGLPGFQFIQDAIDYRTRRHHTNMDVYDGLIPEDLMKNSVIMAGFAYHAAMRDGLIPRKPLSEDKN